MAFRRTSGVKDRAFGSGNYGMLEFHIAQGLKGSLTLDNNNANAHSESWNDHETLYAIKFRPSSPVFPCTISNAPSGRSLCSRRLNRWNSAMPPLCINCQQSASVADDFNCKYVPSTFHVRKGGSCLAITNQPSLHVRVRYKKGLVTVYLRK